MDNYGKSHKHQSDSDSSATKLRELSPGNSKAACPGQDSQLRNLDADTTSTADSSPLTTFTSPSEKKGQLNSFSTMQALNRYLDLLRIQTPSRVFSSTPAVLQQEGEIYPENECRIFKLFSDHEKLILRQMLHTNSLEALLDQLHTDKFNNINHFDVLRQCLKLLLKYVNSCSGHNSRPEVRLNRCKPELNDYALNAIRLYLTQPDLKIGTTSLNNSAMLQMPELTPELELTLMTMSQAVALQKSAYSRLNLDISNIAETSQPASLSLTLTYRGAAFNTSESHETTCSAAYCVLGTKLAELQGGKTRFCTVDAEKASIEIVLPFADAERLDTSLNLTAKSHADKTFSVLYIEDNEQHALLVAYLLRKIPNIHLIHSLSGEQGLDEAKGFKPDLILLDIELGNMDGIQFIQQLTSSVKHPPPVIAISATILPERIAHALQSGAKHYITKPYNGQYLLELLEQEIHQKRLRQALDLAF